MIIELFSAAGGLAEGFRRAGIHFDLVIDRDPAACDSYEANLGARPVQMDAHDLLRLVRAGWRPAAAIELFVADPPCAPWSRAGKRQGLADERDMLAETVELIMLLRPRRYLVGNIPGLQDKPHWPVVQRTIGGLAAHGYCVADFAVLDAADYGVPQRRERPFWFGHLTGPCIRWPAPTHCDPARAGGLFGLGLLPWVTVREALAHLPPEELGRPVKMKLRPNRNKSATEGKIGSDVTRCSSPELEAIAAHLGEPDRKSARRGTMGIEAHLYAGRRVEAAEATEAWRSWRAGRVEKRDARAAARARAAAELVARMERWNPGLRAAPLEEVRELAIEHYNDRRLDRMLRDAERGYDDHDVGAPAALDSDPEFLARIAVNFIRHRMTRYGAALRACGKNDAAVAVVRRRVYEAITTAYPDLAEEARRQHERRGGAR